MLACGASPCNGCTWKEMAVLVSCTPSRHTCVPACFLMDVLAPATATCHPLVLVLPQGSYFLHPLYLSVALSLCRMMSSLKRKYSNCTSEFSARTAIFGSCVDTYYGNYITINGSVAIHCAYCIFLSSSRLYARHQACGWIKWSWSCLNWQLSLRFERSPLWWSWEKGGCLVTRYIANPDFFARETTLFVALCVL